MLISEHKCFPDAYDECRLRAMPNENDLPRAVCLLKEPEVLRRTGLSGDLIALLEDRGLFPRRVPLTERRVGWVEHEVENWITARIAARDDIAEAERLRFERTPIVHRRKRELDPEPAGPV